jgi:hypothetical protein
MPCPNKAKARGIPPPPKKAYNKAYFQNFSFFRPIIFIFFITDFSPLAPFGQGAHLNQNFYEKNS